MRPAVRGIGPGSLQPRRARSYVHARANSATFGWTKHQPIDEPPKAASNITDGPEPLQLTCSLKPPTSIRRPGGRSRCVIARPTDLRILPV